MQLWPSLTILVALVEGIHGHGMMISPAARTTMWRHGFTPAKVNYNDNEMFCGGMQKTKANLGKCGVCGDDYSGFRLAEPGPDNQYAFGTIVDTYVSGSVVEFTSRVTVSHGGFFEYKLCPNDVPQVGKDASVRVTQDCFDNHVLPDLDGNTVLEGGAANGEITHSLKLPEGVSCTNCVIQWRWKVGNSYGCDDSGCGLGKGYQEEFWNCADVKIVPSDNNGAQEPSTGRPTPGPTTPAPTTAPARRVTVVTDVGSDGGAAYDCVSHKAQHAGHCRKCQQSDYLASHTGTCGAFCTCEKSKTAKSCTLKDPTVNVIDFCYTTCTLPTAPSNMMCTWYCDCS